MLLQAQDSFVEAYPDRGLVKKWVRGKIKEIGEYRKGCWEIKAEALQAAGGQSSCLCCKAVQGGMPLPERGQGFRPDGAARIDV